MPAQQHTLRVALDWTPNTLHTGLYLSLTHGFYTLTNLNVELLPPDPSYSSTPAKRVLDGEADLAICPSESCIAYHESGKARLQAIYAICQHDASAIVSTKGDIESPKDLSGRKYGSYNARYEDGTVQAMISADGGDGSKLQIERQTGKLSLFEELRKGSERVDATWIFLPWEGVEADMDGTYMRKYPPTKYGVPYGYSPVIARNASGSVAAEALEAFVDCTAMGYRYALDNPAEAAGVMSRFVEPKKNMEFLRQSQSVVNKYYGDRKSVGKMDGKKWEEWIKWLEAKELVKEGSVKAEELWTNEFFGN